MPNSSARDQMKLRAACADSRMTAPSWPVKRRPWAPGRSVAST